jgi:excisionase family DNA binding protein
MPAQEPFIPLREACSYLGVKMDTARKWIRAKVLRSKRTPGGRHMVLRSDVERLYR